MENFVSNKIKASGGCVGSAPTKREFSQTKLNFNKKRLASFDKIYYGNIDELLTKETGNLVWGIGLILGKGYKETGEGFCELF